MTPSKIVLYKGSVRIIIITLLILAGAAGCAFNIVTPVPALPNISTPIINFTSTNPSTGSLGTTLQPSPLRSPSPSYTAVPSPTPSPTLINPVKDIQQTATALVEIAPRIEERCMELQSGLLEALGYQLVYSVVREKRPYPARSISHSLPIPQPSYVLDFFTGDQHWLGLTSYETVSPDGRQMAYYNQENNVVVIMDLLTEERREVSFTPNSPKPAMWLNESKLLLNNPNYNNLSSAISSSLIILDITSMKWSEITPTFPDIDDQRVFYSWIIEGLVIPDQTQGYFAYPRYETSTASFPLTIFEVDSYKILAHFGYTNRTDTPQWHPTEPMLLFNTIITEELANGVKNEDGTDLFVMNKYGGWSRLTYFTAVNISEVARYVWSPNGSKIAFLSLDPIGSNKGYTSKTPKLMVMDLEFNIIYDFCDLKRLPYDDSFKPVWPPLPVWSLDGKYLAVTVLDETFTYQIWVLEVETGEAWHITEDARAIGWKRLTD